MTNTFEKRKEEFNRECKIINLRYEYLGYTGKERWAIITELSEVELCNKYPDVIKRYIPFVLLSVAQGKVIEEAKRNDDKYAKRNKRTIDTYGYQDDISEQFHKELIIPYLDPIEAKENERINKEKEKQRMLEIERVQRVLAMMQPVQRQRLIKSVIDGKTSREIAKEEGTYHSSVNKSINAAIKNFKKIYENL